MNLFKLIRRQQIQPYSLPDLMKRAKSADYWISVIGALLLGVGILVTGFILYTDAHVRPQVEFAKTNWRARFETGADCDFQLGAKSKDCPVHPKSSLWESELRRGSPEFLDRYHETKNDPFWLALSVSPDELNAAEKASATTLLLPKLNGLVQVWIDGVYQTTYNSSQQRVPLQMTLSKSRLASGVPLAVAIGVFPYPHQPVPETTSDSPEGFYTPLDADRLSRSSVFFSTSQNLIALGLFLVVAGFLWSISATGRTRDYSIGTQIGLLIALTSLLSVDLSFRIFSVKTYESIFFTLLILEALLISRFTWTVLRGSRGTSRLEVASLVAAVFVPWFFGYSQWIEESGASLMTSWILPLIYFGCSAVVGSRYAKLVKQASSSNTRRRFLGLTTLAFALTGAAYVLEARNQSGFYVIWSRWINLFVLFGLVRVFTKSHQTKSSLIELSPKSSFHRGGELPAQVEGWILSLSVLKFSTDRQVMSTILSHLWTISQLNDGEVIRADEGSLLVLFNSTADESEDLRIVRALADMSRCVKDLEQRLPIIFPSQDYSTSILFRAAALKGVVQPAWHTGESGLSHIPMWVDIEPHHSIRSTKELLATDLDAAIRSNDSSIVVLSLKDSERLSQKGLLSERARLSLGSSETAAFIASRLVGRSTNAKPKVARGS